MTAARISEIKTRCVLMHPRDVAVVMQDHLYGPGNENEGAVLFDWNMVLHTQVVDRTSLKPGEHEPHTWHLNFFARPFLNRDRRRGLAAHVLQLSRRFTPAMFTVGRSNRWQYFRLAIPRRVSSAGEEMLKLHSHVIFLPEARDAAMIMTLTRQLTLADLDDYDPGELARGFTPRYENEEERRGPKRPA